MARRIDYLNDPNAPKANSIVPPSPPLSDDTGRLLICRSDNGNWALPGGAVDGESTEAGAREPWKLDPLRNHRAGGITDRAYPLHQQQ